jgi:hypothetical protein
MVNELSRAQHYRRRAQEFRVIAESIPNEQIKEALLGAAASFDQLADNAKISGPLSSLFTDAEAVDR